VYGPGPSTIVAWATDLGGGPTPFGARPSPLLGAVLTGMGELTNNDERS
jgi:hypothetical protein